jgi:hypothetical protein
MLRALNAGQVKLYGSVVEKLTGIRRQLAMRLLFEVAGEGLAVQCRAVDLPMAEFVEIYTIARKARPSDPELIRHEASRLAKLYTAITRDTARTVVTKWRRNPDYLAALRALEMVRPAHV